MSQTTRRNFPAAATFVATVVLSLALAFSTPVINGVSILALLLLGAGAWTTWHLLSTHVELDEQCSSVESPLRKAG